jgi:glycosyltransferase involved in cell wall biosynthesis
MNKSNHIEKKPIQSVAVLNLVLSIGETSAPYNEFSLALSNKYDITLCTYFKSNITPPETITYFEGDDSIIGFFRTLNTALSEKDYDIIHAHSPHVGFLFLLVTMFRPRKRRATVYTFHSSLPNYKKLRLKLLLIPVFIFFQKIVCCSQASFDSLRGFYQRLAGSRLCVVRNGVNIARIDGYIENRREYLSNGRFTVAVVGRLIATKNPLVVLKSFQQSADRESRLVFIGEGNLHQQLFEQSRWLGIGKQIELTGMIPRDKVYEALAETDLLVSASYVEGLPVAVLEAMACGCPVLLSDIASHREIAEGVDFIPLIDPDDMSGFSREIKRFEQMPASKIADIGSQCRKLVEQRFDISVMHRGYKKIYEQIADRS